MFLNRVATSTSRVVQEASRRWHRLRPHIPHPAFRSEDVNVSSLTKHCYATLTRASCDSTASSQQLQDLPQPVLVSLLQRCAEERDELQRRCDAQASQLQQLQSKAAAAYYVNPPFCDTRLDEQGLGPWPDDDTEGYARYRAEREVNRQHINRRLEGIKAKWSTQPPVERLAAELRREVSQKLHYPTTLRYSQEDQCFKLAADFDMSIPIDLHVSRLLPRVISSSLLLYRLCCLFEVGINTSSSTDRYKCVWTVDLWHAATGRRVVLDEHKGAAAVHVNWPAVEDPQLNSDFLELMNLLCGDCPHPYDYLRAGCVA